MKILYGLLVLSLLGNIFGGFRLSVSPSSSKRAEASQNSFKDDLDQIEVRSGKSADDRVASDGAGKNESVLARLRRANAPESLIKAVGVAWVKAKYARQFARLQKTQPNAAYWNQGFAYEAEFGIDEEFRKNMEKLTREQDAEIRRYTGSDSSEVVKMLPHMYRQFGLLDDTKIERAGKIMSDYAAVFGAELANNGGQWTPEMQKQFEDGQRAELAEILTPQELQEYDLRSGALAGVLRRSLEALRPSEDEFRDIWSIYEAAGDSAGAVSEATVDQVGGILNEQLLAQLGAERFEDFKLAANREYSSLNGVMVRLNLPLSTVPDLLRMQEDFRKRARQIHQKAGITRQVRRRQLEELARSAERDFSNKLGQDGYGVYKSAAGVWMNVFEPIIKD